MKTKENPLKEKSFMFAKKCHSNHQKENNQIK